MHFNLFEINRPTFVRTFILLILSVAAASCGTSRQATVTPDMNDTPQQRVIAFGMKYLKKPYRLGAKGPNSFDCSGFTAFVFREFGYRLNPTSASQARQFPSVTNRKELQTGDLVFFEGHRRNGVVGHVGIVTEVRTNGHFKFIHASTTKGVIVSSSEEAYYRVRYLKGARVIDAKTFAYKQAKINEAKKKQAEKKRAEAAAKAKTTAKPDTTTKKTIRRNGEVQIAVAHTKETSPWVKYSLNPNIATATVADATPKPATQSEKNIPQKSKNLIKKFYETPIIEPETAAVPEPVINTID